MTVHTFLPNHYHVTLGSHAPVLHICSGDTVRTQTVDAWGQDHTGAKVSRAPNPMTGPFYIEGAGPGDTLAVTIDAITPNRREGWVRTPLAYNVVDPDAVRGLPDRDHALGFFDVDVDTGLARLTHPETPKLAGLTLPLSPMIGCFGVAPEDGQAISTATSGPYGGNMDYNGFVAGVEVHFPVFVPGALFHLGDVHARQGDGEISGTGIEISADVSFTVRVIKNHKIGTVRGQNDTYIFTAGNARPLDQALQHATTEMQAWLTGEFGFTAIEAGILMGQCIRYDVGNVYDPAYTMVCKMAKSVLVV
jgi:amidase